MRRPGISPDWGRLYSDLERDTGISLCHDVPEDVGGGSINACWRIRGGRGSYFLKLNRRQALPMFEAEVAGLNELRSARAIRVPEPIGTGASADFAYLLMEWISLCPAENDSERLLGERLARQHEIRHERFGWHRNNYIGSTPQDNGQSSDWISFFTEKRLGAQLDLAARNGYGKYFQDRSAALLQAVPDLFSTYRPAASLLHGDLWGGNWGCDERHEPVIFDPAVYYGDRECDIAMTRLFGGFGRTFYEAYHAAWPLDAGAAARASLYNLYHVLNHLNLFGPSYAGQARSLMDRVLSHGRP